MVWTSSGNFDPISVNGLANCLHIDINSISGLDFSMYFGYWTDVYVYQKGNFLETYQKKQYLQLLGSSYKYNLDYEVVSVENDQCIADLQYSKDECIWNEIDTVSNKFNFEKRQKLLIVDRMQFQSHSLLERTPFSSSRL